MTARTLYPQTRLSALAARPGGQAREKALAEAGRRIEARRPPSLNAIGALIESLEIAIDGPDVLPGGKRTDIAGTADRVVGLALLLGLDNLAEAAMRLCDLCLALPAGAAMPAEPVAVHVRALRLLAPDGTRLAQAEARDILKGLGALIAHFGKRA